MFTVEWRKGLIWSILTFLHLNESCLNWLGGILSNLDIGQSTRYRYSAQWSLPICLIWASMQENLSSGFVNNKGSDQNAHMCSLISTFVIRYLKSIVAKLAPYQISIIWLVYVTEETGFSLLLSETPKTGFVASRPVYNMPLLSCTNQNLDL